MDDKKEQKMGRQTNRFIFWLHITLMIPCLIIALVVWILSFTTQSILQIPSQGGYWASFFSLVVVAPLTIAVGFWCLYRAWGNVVGVLLIMWGCGVIAIVSTYESQWYSLFSYFYSWIIWPALFFLIVYFPNGNILPIYWAKWVNRLVVLTYLNGFLYTLSTQKELAQAFPNPLHIPFLAPLQPIFTNLAGLSLLLAILMGIRSLYLQFRTDDVQVRYQIKWLLFGIVPIIFVGIFQLLMQIFFNARANDGGISQSVGYLSQIYLRFLPLIAVGNAILRHRLYDIDIIIRRTVIYSILTTILAIVYFGGIVLLQRIFQNITGQNSELAIVASTLLIVAMFTPLRRRIQDTIDRRFYRRKYNAEQTIAKFNETLRDEVDLETLKANLVNVVQETLEPSSIRIWIKEPSERK
jgi:hypothetical protein